MNIKRCVFYLFFVLAIAMGCANPQGPTGGPDDKLSPVLDTKYSTDNEQINYKREPIIFTFDEFVSIKDANNQIVVSPPLKYNLDVQARGKKVITKLHPDEELLPNTTYSIFFGEAIQDFTVGNPVQGLNFVFSTGDELDTAFTKIKVVTSDRKMDLSKLLVFAHEDLSDTAFTNLKPRYIARVDSQGNARLSYMKEGEYRIYILEDKNRNYTYDPGQEIVGFNPDETYVVSETDILSVTFNVFNPSPHPTIFDAQKINQDSFLKFTVQGDISALSCYSLDSEEKKIQPFEIQDTFYLPNEFSAIVFKSPYEYLDTFIVEDIPATESRIKNQLKTSFLKQFSDRYEFQLEFLFPVSLTSDSMVVVMDSIQQPFELNDRRNIQIIRLTGDTIRRIQVEIPRQGIESTVPFKEDISVRKSVPNREDLSALILNVTELDSSKQYILQIVTESGKVLDERTFQNVKTYRWDKGYVAAEQMNIRIVTDRNRNGQWDNGSYLLKSYPEEFKEMKITELRPSWDLEFSVTP